MFKLIKLVALAASMLALNAYAGTPQTVVLDVKNMTCALCPITVQKSLTQVPGVTQAKIDFEKKTATVVFDPDKANPSVLAKATTNAGYPSTARK